jgi:ATP-binding protein involved in chromosome partitioning
MPMQSQISQLLETFTPASDAALDQADNTLSHTLSDDVVDLSVIESGSDVTVNLVLPYAAKSLADELKNHLAQHIDGRQFTVNIHCQLNQSECFKQIKNIVLVASGKGGVGKSTTAVNLALALSQEGAKVGLLDADIYGPSIPIMLGMQGQKPTSKDGKIMEPLEGYGVKVNSIGFLIAAEDAAVWRGPMASSALSQLIGETNWGELDYLIVDMPPGTGDIQLTISQKFPCTGSVIVTTPQNIALADAEKGVNMFAKVNIPVLGIIENMSYFSCSACGHIDHIFGQDGALALADKYSTQLLGQIPLEKENRENGDKGTPSVTLDNPVALLYRRIARRLSKSIYQNHTASSGPEISFIND